MKKCIRAAALLLIAMMMILSFSRPAAAVKTQDVLIISGGVIGGLIVVTLIGTMIVYRRPQWSSEFLTKRPSRADTHEPGLRFGPACARSADGQTPMLCW